MANGPESAGLHINELFINQYTSTIGARRPIAERTAYGPLKKLLSLQGVPIGDIPTKYTDSRAETQMNVYALEALAGGETQQMHDSFDWLREKYFTYIQATPVITDHHLLKLALLGEALPGYLLLRAHNPLGRQDLPDVIGNIYQASMGFRNVAGNKMDEERERTYADGKAIYIYADRNHLFYPGQLELKKFTCPASAQHVTSVATTLLFGNGNDADPQRSHLAEHISDTEFGNLVRFSGYNFQYTNSILQLQHNAITLEEFSKMMADLQDGMNVELGRDPQSIPPPSRHDFHPRMLSRFTFPKGGPIDTARIEIKHDLAAIHTEQQASTRNQVVFHQRTRKKKRK